MKPFAAVLALVALVLGFSLLFRSGGNAHPTQTEMEAILVCTECHEPIAESTSILAQQMKVEVRRQIAAGWSKDQIEAYFVKNLGPQAIGVPGSSGFDLFAWLLPFGAIIFGGAAVGLGARAWLRNRDDVDGAALTPAIAGMSPDLERRVDQELDRFDT